MKWVLMSDNGTIHNSANCYWRCKCSWFSRWLRQWKLTRKYRCKRTKCPYITEFSHFAFTSSFHPSLNSLSELVDKILRNVVSSVKKRDLYLATWSVTSKKEKTNRDGHDWERFTRIVNTWRGPFKQSNLEISIKHAETIYVAAGYFESLFPGFFRTE